MSEEQKKPSEWQQRDIGALWKRQAANGGQTYLSGHVKVDEMGVEKTVKVVVFSNKNKEKDNQPDFRVYLSKPREEAAVAQPSAEEKDVDLNEVL